MIRRIVGLREGRPLFSDVLGTLTGLTDVATVRTDRGAVTVPLMEVALGKRVPPRRWASATQIAALEWAAAAAWPAPETERLGGWLLRAAGGFTGRANSALPLGDPGRSLPEAVEQTIHWYQLRNLPARINVPLPLARPVDELLDADGWERSPLVLVQCAPLPALATEAPDVELTAEPSDEWLAMMAGIKGSLPDVARSILTGPEQVRFASVIADGRLAAIGRGAVGDGRLHLGLIQVATGNRRRGYARKIINALAQWAVGLGAESAYLQVEERNEAAVALYRSLGFTTHHTYVTRTATR